MEIVGRRLSRLVYIFSAFSFAPYLGFLCAPIFIVWGLVTKKGGGNLLASIGVLGAVSSWLISVGLNHAHDLRQENLHLDKHLSYRLPDIVQSIEAFRGYDGDYPATLEVLWPQTPGAKGGRLGKEVLARLHYEVSEAGESYFLLGIGADNTPFTPDDILPAPDSAASESSGLSVKR